MKFETLHNAHEGETVHVIGASKMMDNVKPEFFENRITIGTNFAYQHFPCKYTITRHYKVIKEWLHDPKPDSLLYHPEWIADLGGAWMNEIGNYFDWRDKPKELFRSRGIMGTAIDFARYTGAGTIIIWGVECNNDYMCGYNNMKDCNSATEFNETNRNNIETITELIQLKYGTEIIWM